MSANQLNFPKLGIPLIFIGVLALIFFFRSFVRIGAGEAGVLYETIGEGVVTDEPPLGEGINFVLPWNDVIKYEVRQQSISDKMQVLSVNGLEVEVDATVWFQPDSDKLGFLHQEKGQNYIQNILGPAISEAARRVVGRYTPEQLYSSKRDVIKQEIFEETQKEVADQYILVNRVLIKDVTLPTAIKDAIERKLKQEQESLEYEFRLVTADKEAQKQRIEAQGKADANKILSASLTDKILQDKGIEATLELSKSPNSKVVIVGSSKDGLPLILGNN